MKRKPRIGLLPLYLELYDETLPDLLPNLRPFLGMAVQGFEERGIEVLDAPVSRTARSVAEAVGLFEKQEVDLIVTLHLAYSPSLEAIDALAATRTPILMLDTTMDHDFGPTVDPIRILYNHGIHGVMDLASMLRRRGKSFEIVAGHITESTALERAADAARAAYGAAALRNARALRIGGAFKGMGDFAVPSGALSERLGIHVDEIPVAALAAKAAAVEPGQIDAEMKADAGRFRLDLDAEVHRRSVRVGLGLREYLEEGRYDAFSMNFQAFDSDEEPIDTVPFLEASKAMARGVGYAGEGDALTAALVGALSRAFGKATFCEVFCPDWRGNALFLSHMGEINPEVAASKPVLREKDYPFSAALNPAFLACGVAPGPAVFVNLAPGPNDAFELIVAPVEVLAETRLNPKLEEWVRAWIRPRRGIAEFLEAYSRLGGTHHSALVLGDRVEAVRTFALFAGLPCHTL